MRIRQAVIIALVAASLWPLAISAQTADDELAFERHRIALLTALRESKTESEAAVIARRVARLWRNGPDIVATGLLLDVDAHIRIGDQATALEILDQITRDYPNWAEGWNMRATFLFFERRYDESLTDIERTLELEPSHFGALAGQARIYVEQGRYVEAREAIRRAVAIHPWMPERRLLDTLPRQNKI